MAEKLIAKEATGEIKVKKMGVNHYLIEVIGLPTDKAPLSASGKTKKLAHNGFGLRLPDGNSLHLSLLARVGASSESISGSTKTTVEGF